MPKKELLQPCLAARGTIATDITTLSALHKHITHAINATTFNLSGITKVPSCPLPPVSIPLSIPSAVHFTNPPLFLPFSTIASMFLPPPPCSDKFPHFRSILYRNPKRGFLKRIEFKWASDSFEDLAPNARALEVTAAFPAAGAMAETSIQTEID